MCGGGGCSSVGLCMGEMAYTVERFCACIAATAVVSTIIFTLLWMLGAGVGIGYNYCFVESRLNATLGAAKSFKQAPPPVTESTTQTTSTKITTTKTPPEPPVKRRRRSKDLFWIPLEKPLYLDKYKVYNRPEENLGTLKISNNDWNVKQMESSTDSDIEIKPTIVVPIRHFDLLILIKKLQNKSRNFTLELITGNS